MSKVNDGGGPASLSIVIPVRDETLNLIIMIRLLNAAIAWPHEILVVYDNPDDKSVAVISKSQKEFPNVMGVQNALGRGVAFALQAGVAAAQSDRILVFAADEVGPLLAVDDMVALMDEGCEFVSCTRYAHGGRRLGGARIGHLLSYTANKTLGLVSAVALTDATTGIKLFRRSDFDRLTHKSNSVGWAVAFEMAVNAQVLGLALGEVPVISVDRLFGGKSTFRIFPWVAGYLGFFFLAIRKLPMWPIGSRAKVKVRIPLNLSGD